MSVITVFSGTFCNEASILQSLQEHLGYRFVNDTDLIESASRQSGLAKDRIGRAFSARASVFNKFTHERERSIAYLRLALAQVLIEDQLLVNGFASQLVSSDISHVLRVCLIADTKSRSAAAAAELKVSSQESLKLIRKHDEDRAHWMKTLFKAEDPYAADLYDMVLPTDKMDVEEITTRIVENARKSVVKVSGPSRQVAQDFLLAAQVDAALVEQGHLVEVKAREGNVTLTIHKHVLMLHRLENELKSLVGNLPGVNNIETEVGPDFYQADIYRKQDFNMPSKILLVDDEREFVQTLSERLLMRDMRSAVAYDGESALEVVREDEPDVMILDLKMPGIDGIEVLRRVKATQPEIEVIILTGHGSEADRATCMELGAFAYLQKPVDVEALGETINRANEKIKQRRDAGTSPEK